VQAARPYAENMVEVLGTTASRRRVPAPVPGAAVRANRALVILVTADRGLCGALNSNTLRAVTAT